jgi:hypothetical protein
LTHALDRFNIETSRCEWQGTLASAGTALPVELDEKDLLPAIPVGDEEEGPTLVDPMGLVEDIDPGVVMVLEGNPQTGRLWVEAPNDEMVLEAVDLLDQKPTRGLVIGDISQVFVAVAMVAFTVTGDGDPDWGRPLLTGVNRDDANANGGVSVACLGVVDGDEGRVLRVGVVDEMDNGDLGLVKLPISDLMTIGGPPVARSGREGQGQGTGGGGERRT